MKNILTTVAMATLFTGLALSSATAASVLSVDGNSSYTNIDQNISIDRAGLGTDVNLTLIPTFTFQGASFDLVFENGGIATGTQVELCVFDDTNITGAPAYDKWVKVGGLQGSGTPVNGVMVNPKFSFIDDASTGLLIKKDSNITFNTGSCSTRKVLTIVGAGTETCKTISAEVKNPKSTQAQDLPDLATNKASFGKTAQFIKISCTAPECFVISNKLKFTEATTVAGVNVALTLAGAKGPNHDIVTAECPECDKKADTTTTCSTSIIIKNTAVPGTTLATELNVSKLNVVANFDGTLNTDLKFALDGNGSADSYTLGTVLPKNVLLQAGNDVNITLVFSADGVKEIGIGNVSATISGLETNASKPVLSNFKDVNITTIKEGARTRFTVPYMSAEGASQTNFVKISTVSGAGSTPLSAVIADSEGHSCPVTLNDIPANGGSTFVFASALPTGNTNYQSLIPAGECSGLTTGLYSVDFSAGASVNAVGFMRTKRGERTIDIF